MSIQSKIRSKAMGVLSSAGLAGWHKNKARYLRYLRIGQPEVLYFHQVDDPYSYLAAQKLEQLQQAYSLNFVPHLVGPPADQYKGDASKFDQWARTDASQIAEYFGCNGLEAISSIEPAQVELANARLLESMDGATLGQFAQCAVDIGAGFWQKPASASKDITDDQEPSQVLSTLTASRVQRALQKGNQLRERLGHYLSGAFYFEGEWFGGLDRLHLLEARLRDEGFSLGDRVVPLPTVADFVDGPVDPAHSIEVDYFPSLRSPYTAIGHRRFLQLIETSGVKVNLKPVMPMMMRGVQAPIAKQRYIMSDSGRESRFYGDAFGPFCDPFGDPILHAFAAYHFADTQELGMNFVTQYLGAAFAEGLDITTDEGLIEVCRRAGFDYQFIDFDADWMPTLERNLGEMATSSLWGVPSFRVSGGNDPHSMACWGQDRIWRVAAEIAKRTAVTD